jgi:FMN reductase (NADPH)
MTTVQEPRITSETIDTLNQRVSVRDYSDKPVDDNIVRALLNAARRSATSSNTQTYSFVVVRDPDKKRELARLAGDQQHIIDAPVFVAICADLSRMAQAAAVHGQSLAVNLELSMVAIVDAAIVGQSLSLAAESLGLGTVMIGAMRNHPQEAAELLSLPEGAFVVYGLCIGWPARRAAQKPRLPEAVMIHYEQYSPVNDAALAAHDADLAAHYESQGRKTFDAAWTGFVARKFIQKNRTSLREVLEKRGFRFD